MAALAPGVLARGGNMPLGFFAVAPKDAESPLAKIGFEADALAEADFSGGRAAFADGLGGGGAAFLDGLAGGALAGFLAAAFFSCGVLGATFFAGFLGAAFFGAAFFDSAFFTVFFVELGLLGFFLAAFNVRLPAIRSRLRGAQQTLAGAEKRGSAIPC